MALLYLTALFALATSVKSWPQYRNGSDVLGSPITAEHIPSKNVPRSLPEVDESQSHGTLPVPRISKRDAFGNLPSDQSTDDKRSLPVVDGQMGLMTLPVIHAEIPSLQRRGVEVKLENRSDVAYYAELNIGNPPQKVFAQVDTGSFELWVNPDCSNLPPSDARFCQAIGNYKPKQSNTSVVSDLTTELRYGIGSASITYVLDDISLSGSSQTMKRVQFGVAQSSQDQFSGILGIGHGVGINTGYKNFVDQLASQGITKTKAYSVGLGSKTEKQGVIVFGGVDTARYSGKLAPLPLIPANDSPDGVARFWVNMNSLSHTQPSGETVALSKKAMPVFFDTGATLTLLPPDLANAMAKSLNASELDSDGFYNVDCGIVNMNGTLDFAFDGVTIKVPYKEIVREITTLPTSCYLGFMPSDSFSLLGDTFLRSAYVVFDISSNMTYVAQYNNCGSSPQTIGSSEDIAGMVGTCNSQSNNTVSQPPTGGPTGGKVDVINGNNKQDTNKDNASTSLQMSWSAVMCGVGLALLGSRL